tara:strand:- start:593 stop:1390 length:798 start_codon:yes stop_codon:yes gene_type:complete
MPGVHHFRPVLLAKDPSLVAFAQDERSDRVVATVLNFAQHLRQSKLPSTAGWSGDRGKAKACKATDYFEFYADVQEILEPGIATAFQLPKLNNWHRFLVQVCALHVITCYPNVEGEDPPYLNAARVALAAAEAKSAIGDKALERWRKRCHERETQLQVLSRCPSIATTALAILDHVQAAVFHDQKPNIPILEELIHTLPLMPGVLTHRQMEEREREQRQRDQIQDDEWLNEDLPQRSSAGPSTTPAIWEPPAASAPVKRRRLTEP